jgi:chemotaxis family two-component system sensor kinase Cph1
VVARVYDKRLRHREVMRDLTDSLPGTNLDNCDREPIHLPGSVQPTGALLAFDAGGTVLAWSANAATLLGVTPTAGMRLMDLGVTEPARQILQDCVTQMHEGDVPYVATEVELGGHEFDLIVHAYRSRIIAEFEQRPAEAAESATFALTAHRAIDRLKRHRSIEDMLLNAVRDVRTLTGFDRVMAYKFRHDDSGDIVAEARRDDLEALQGRRYPASDIPAQARRLYTLNTLRLISDVNYTPVPLCGWLDEPLDLSYSVLRSVSPIHIEYLQNMGVGASMSVSIIVDGRLWGMIACHHMTARQVPFAVRMTCDVLAQVIAANVQAIEGRGKAQRIEGAAATRALLVESLLHEEDMLRVIERHAPALLNSLGGEVLIATQFGKVVAVGELAAALVGEIASSLQHEQQSLVQRVKRSEWATPQQAAIGPWVGMLALRFDPATQGALLVLRREQIETVRWGGKPEKDTRVGPLGPRLTPRGSFDEWREVVRDQAEPWDETSLAIARALFGEMQRASNARHAETERARSQLLAMLGHDLRDPLQAITMAATVIGRGAPQEPLTQRIKASSNRMQRLIGIVLDVSRIESGVGLGLVMTPIDLSQVVVDVTDEARIAHPGTDYRVDVPQTLTVHADRDRIGQLISNLISNARHHGVANQPIEVRLRPIQERAIIEVANQGEKIDPLVEATLFSAYKSHSTRNARNPTGMGLGLHIAHAIALGHGGTLAYRHQAPQVFFVASLPLTQPEAPTP